MTLTMDERLERMYSKVSNGKRNGPNMELMPQPLKDPNGRDHYVEVDGMLRRIYQSRPAIWMGNGTPAYATFNNTKPDPKFWGKESNNANYLD